MHKVVTKAVKATIKDIIVALFSVIIILLIIYLFFGQKINNIILLVDTISIDKSNYLKTETTVDEHKKLKNYPEYGTQYANIIIPKISLEAPVYFGDTLKILKNGVGHSSGSYFPGEGGSIVYMGHNSKKLFRNFSELDIGDKIVVNTNYGEFTYKIYDMQIVQETDLEKIPIQSQEEILMIYTCYPFNNIGYTKQRYIVYAKLENIIWS